MERINLTSLFEEGWELKDWFKNLLLLEKDGETICYDLDLGQLV